MSRRKKRIEHDNHERWLISYADFVTLLFAFFVVMYSISSVNESKYKIFSNSLSIAFSSQANSPNDTVVPAEPNVLLRALVDRRTARLGEQQRKIQEKMTQIANGLSKVMSPIIKQGMVSVTPVNRGVILDISASSLFKTGEAVLQPGSLPVLLEVSNVLRTEALPIEVEGHTDDIPISTTQFPSNWELSSARASSVVRKLIENGVPENQLSVVGLASNHPLVPNDGPENRARNRRVTITILSPNSERAHETAE
ncbi:MAG: flagellar motor protein MotD [Gallionella sp.]